MRDEPEPGIADGRTAPAARDRPRSRDGERNGGRSPRTMRVAVCAVFFVTGAAFATWAARVPAVQSRLDLSAGELAVALVGLSGGAFLGLPLVGGLVARYGSRTVLCVGMAAYLGALASLPHVPDLAVLTLALALFACGNTAVDVAMNTQGVLVERAYGRPVLGGFHAMFSLGGITGATAGGLAATAGIGIRAHFTVAALVLLAVAGAAATALAPDPPSAGGPARRDPLLALPGPGLWIPGLVAFCALMGEGVVNDWGAVYLKEETGASPGAAGLGYAVFSAGMVAGRLTADRLRARLGTVRFTLLCAAVAGAGALVPILVATTAAGFVGYGLLGLGMAAVIPLVFAHAAGLRPERTGSSIAAVSAVGYVGFLAGPPVIGALAEATTLRWAMLVLPALMAAMAVLATRLRRP
ncbi:MFS transporter [Streptomyces sp. NPDC058157]|uniref:MFS transporter n=1 Tax=Streptomyces sp. NPDC058157 TaxID=3346360 RepID=UPI0036E6A1E8